MWAADRDALRARFAPVLDEPVPERLTQTALRLQLARRSWALVAGRCGAWSLLAVGVVIGALLAARRPRARSSGGGEPRTGRQRARWLMRCTHPKSGTQWR